MHDKESRASDPLVLGRIRDEQSAASARRLSEQGKMVIGETTSGLGKSLPPCQEGATQSSSP